MRQFFVASQNFMKWKFWDVQFRLSVVCLFLYLFVCLFVRALHVTVQEQSSSNFIHTSPGKNCVHFGIYLPLGPDPGLFRKILQHCEVWHFATISLIILWISWSDLHENFTTDVSLNKDTFDIWKLDLNFALCFNCPIDRDRIIINLILFHHMTRPWPEFWLALDLWAISC